MPTVSHSFIIPPSKRKTDWRRKIFTLQTKDGYAVILAHSTVIGVFPFNTHEELADGLKARYLDSLLPERQVIRFEIIDRMNPDDNRPRYRASTKTNDGYTDIMESLDLKALTKRMTKKWPDALVDSKMNDMRTP